MSNFWATFEKIGPLFIQTSGHAILDPLFIKISADRRQGEQTRNEDRLARLGSRWS